MRTYTVSTKIYQYVFIISIIFSLNEFMVVCSCSMIEYWVEFDQNRISLSKFSVAFRESLIKNDVSNGVNEKATLSRLTLHRTYANLGLLQDNL